MAPRCSARSSAAWASLRRSQPDAALSTARPVMRSNRIRASSCPHTGSESSAGSLGDATSSPDAATLRASVSTRFAPSGIRVRSPLGDPQPEEHLEAFLHLALDLLHLRPVLRREPAHELGKRRRDLEAVPHRGRTAGQLVHLRIARPRHEHIEAHPPVQRIGGPAEPRVVAEPHSRTTFAAVLDPNAFRASNTSFACSATQSRS